MTNFVIVVIEQPWSRQQMENSENTIFIQMRVFQWIESAYNKVLIQEWNENHWKVVEYK